jgi:sugar (pentulose or hexulose) kinase
MAHVIGLDLGTTTITGIVFDTERQEILRLARRGNDASIPGPLPQRAEQDPARLRALAVAVLAELAPAAGKAAGRALTGQMHGLLCVDGDSRPLTPLISWQDHRTAEPLPDGSTTMERLQERLSGLDWQANGCRIQHGYGAATLFWLSQQGALPASTERVCTLAGWLAGQLGGRPAVTDPTFAASWGIYDAAAGTWNTAFVERLGLEAGLLPPVRPSGERVGELAAGLARQVGLPAGLPITNPLGDTQATFLGSVAEPEQGVLLGLGTGGRIAWLVPAFEQPSEQVETRPLPPDRFLRVGASLCGGAAYAWLNRTVRAWLAEFGLELDEGMVYERLNALAAASEDTGSLRVRTTFLGVRGDPTVQAGAIEGITLETMDLGRLARATLLGLVDELYGLYAGHGGPEAGHKRVVGAGGAVRNNPLLPRLIAAQFGLPVEVPPQQETGALGAIRAARHGLF